MRKSARRISARKSSKLGRRVAVCSTFKSMNACGRRVDCRYIKSKKRCVRRKSLLRGMKRSKSMYLAPEDVGRSYADIKSKSAEKLSMAKKALRDTLLAQQQEEMAAPAGPMTSEELDKVFSFMIRSPKKASPKKMKKSEKSPKKASKKRSSPKKMKKSEKSPKKAKKSEKSPKKASKKRSSPKKVKKSEKSALKKKSSPRKMKKSEKSPKKASPKKMKKSEKSPKKASPKKMKKSEKSPKKAMKKASPKKMKKSEKSPRRL
jgi:hypothetical protein